MKSTRFLLIFLPFIMSCSRHYTAPERPENVPASAVWAGNEKGDWFDCDYNQERDWNNCTVYADVSGAVVESGRFQVEGRKRAAIPSELQFAYHTLGKIILKNGKMLINQNPPN